VADPAAFRTFAIEPPHQVRSIRKMLMARIDDMSIQIASPYVKDWADYKERLGMIEGLKQALEFCDEMEKAERK
jgi:hypothetical protein